MNKSRVEDYEMMTVKVMMMRMMMMMIMMSAWRKFRGPVFVQHPRTHTLAEAAVMGVPCDRAERVNQDKGINVLKPPSQMNLLRSACRHYLLRREQD
ncbi:hypothetical protein E2C01_044869 [Portunus trituberculatus]|uniref:Uncharacterized protein n=1 Tax=Portunus trituberculatus TaxID=210409 RepID=A0A5B7FWQ8_PORTR|nr:hypothetical protein [Portunus trituberculatus]